MTIDVTGIDTKAAFHLLMKRELKFPEWYGENWDAFRDAILAVVVMPGGWSCRSRKPWPRPAPKTCRFSPART